MRLHPIIYNGDDEQDGTDDNQLTPPGRTLSPSKTDTVPSKKKGIFTTKSHTLRKKYTNRKYICRMCPERSDSARALTAHHREKHGIVYCKVCKRAFNNPISLRRHEYSHREKKFKCSSCSESFNFNSELKTHLIQHQRHAKHLCAFPGCGKLFKNKSDLTRHGKEHTATAIQCPDCEYSSKDKRNFNSHRRTHSKIELYFCNKCDEGFVFNTQKLRHMAQNACQSKKK